MFGRFWLGPGQVRSAFMSGSFPAGLFLSRLFSVIHPTNRPSQPSHQPPLPTIPPTAPPNHPLQPSLQARTCLLPLVHCPLLLFLTHFMNLLRRNASHLFLFLYCLFFNTRSAPMDPFPTSTFRPCVIISRYISSTWKKI